MELSTETNLGNKELLAASEGSDLKTDTCDRATAHSTLSEDVTGMSDAAPACAAPSAIGGESLGAVPTATGGARQVELGAAAVQEMHGDDDSPSVARASVAAETSMLSACAQVHSVHSVLRFPFSSPTIALPRRDARRLECWALKSACLTGCGSA